MGRLTYKGIGEARFKPQRNIVISEAYNNKNELLGYSVAEQLVTEENGEEVKLFLKGGLGIIDKTGLIELKKAVDDAVEKVLEK